MHLKLFQVKNFRRLQDVRIDLHPETSIFVGSNNSGKTSATHIFQLFLGETKGQFSIYDFSSECWEEFDRFDSASQDPDIDLPHITLDMWFDIDDLNLHRIVALLPSLEWEGAPVGIRLTFQPRDSLALLQNYDEAHRKAQLAEQKKPSYKPWPFSLTDYLKKRLLSEYEIRYAVLDAAHFDDNFDPLETCDPFPLGTATSGASKIVESLIRVDFLDAQRNLSDGESKGRHEDLSKRLSRYYARNLQKHEDDLEALAAIADSESRLNTHFAKAFEPVLGSLRELGYPGLGNHELVVKADFNASTILNGNAHVHYALPQKQPSRGGPTLPDRYNGLGFKNLIYMAVEILDFHHAWSDTENERPPVHLLMIEEPESHLHAQLQQVFVRKIMDILPKPIDGFQTQMIVTTHSSHVLYESTFKNIRYFRRAISNDLTHTSEVRNLSTFYDIEESITRDFLLQYLKLTHCDLFFADAALLVEGNVERLLLPLMIEKEYPNLRASHLTILEVGGAFAHKFEKLIEFLELPTLIITDLDSVEPPAAKPEQPRLDLFDHAEDEPEDSTAGKKCIADQLDAVTSNETLKKWIPRLRSIDSLLLAADNQKQAVDSCGRPRKVRVAYQTAEPVSWRDSTATVAGRTLEEAFALENLAWCQDPARKHLGLMIRGNATIDLHTLRERIFKRVTTFDKTRFALGLISQDISEWITPTYISQGLSWLQATLSNAADTRGTSEPAQNIAE